MTISLMNSSLFVKLESAMPTFHVNMHMLDSNNLPSLFCELTVLEIWDACFISQYGSLSYTAVCRYLSLLSVVSVVLKSADI